MSGFHAICCVVNMGDGSKVVKAAKKYGVKGATISIGRGTLHSKVLEFLGIEEVRKEIITLIIETKFVSDTVKGISEKMAFHKPHHGIAFSYPIADFTGSRNTPIAGVECNENTERGKGMYNIIYVVVERGKGEDVIEAASKAGSRGGTIMNARGAGVHEVQKLFSVDIEPEREVVFILSKREEKSGIVESIRSHLKMDVPGNGVMFILEADEVYGLN
jgi:nitrogen regulatory protein PII